MLRAKPSEKPLPHSGPQFPHPSEMQGLFTNPSSPSSSSSPAIYENKTEKPAKIPGADLGMQWLVRIQPHTPRYATPPRPDDLICEMGTTAVLTQGWGGQDGWERACGCSAPLEHTWPTSPLSVRGDLLLVVSESVRSQDIRAELPSQGRPEKFPGPGGGSPLGILSLLPLSNPLAFQAAPRRLCSACGFWGASSALTKPGNASTVPRSNWLRAAPVPSAEA